MNIKEWLSAPAKDDAENLAKEFLMQCRRPSINRDYSWIYDNPLFCTHGGNRWRCVGVSLLGDALLSKNLDRAYGYDIRPDINECSDWGKNA